MQYSAEFIGIFEKFLIYTRKKSPPRKRAQTVWKLREAYVLLVSKVGRLKLFK
jgi:hypothetical protein